jgi:type I restriction enzyme R subunit
MGFNELNSVEHYIIQKLSGINLNEADAAEPQVQYSGDWQYLSAQELNKGINEVLLEEHLKAALIRLNPEIQTTPDLADEVIYKVRQALLKYKLHKDQILFDRAYAYIKEYY